MLTAVFVHRGRRQWGVSCVGGTMQAGSRLQANM